MERKSPTCVLGGVSEYVKTFGGVSAPITVRDLRRSWNEKRYKRSVVGCTKLERPSAHVYVEVIGLGDVPCGFREHWRKPTTLERSFGTRFLHGLEMCRDLGTKAARRESQRDEDYEIAHGASANILPSPKRAGVVGV